MHLYAHDPFVGRRILTMCCTRGVGGLVKGEQTSKPARSVSQQACLPPLEASSNSKIIMCPIDAEGNHQTSFQNIHSDTT